GAVEVEGDAGLGHRVVAGLTGDHLLRGAQLERSRGQTFRSTRELVRVAQVGGERVADRINGGYVGHPSVSTKAAQPPPPPSSGRGGRDVADRPCGDQAIFDAAIGHEAWISRRVRRLTLRASVRATRTWIRWIKEQIDTPGPVR